MSQETVRAALIQRATAVTTATGNSIPGARGPYSITVEAQTTGTSIVTAACVLQASATGSSWFAISSATVLGTSASATAAATYASTVVAYSTAAHAQLRTVLIVTGTGAASAILTN